MNAIIVVIFAAILLAMFIFWTAFRNWVGRQLNAIWGLITLYAPAAATWLVNTFRLVVRVLSIYSLILLCVTIFALVLMAIALLINSPGLTAFTFVFAICLVLFTWMPAGIILRLFHITDGVVPKTLKMLVAWTAFVGFLGLMCPEVLTFKSLLGAALVGFIFLGITTKINALDRIVFPLVVTMCLWTAWGYFWPESFRSTTRYTESWAKRIQTHKDRGSIDNETDAATTYGVVLRKVSVAYTLSNKSKDVDVLIENEVSLEKGDTVKITSHKQEVKVIDGQGFVQITLAKENGSFVRGKKYWVEAEYVQLATPRQITPEDDSLFKKKTSSVSTNYVGGKFLVGEHTLALQNGQESDWCSIQDCHSYTFLRGDKCRFVLVYEDGTIAQSWGSTTWPGKYKFKVRNLSTEMPILKVI